MEWGNLVHLEWRAPWWLLLALQPLAAGLLLKLRRTRVLHYADTHLHPWTMLGRFAAGYRAWRTVAMVVGWLLLACAAAGPRLPLGTDPEQRADVPYHRIDLMVVLDVSPSMAATDVSPQRLERARLELQDLLHRLRGERIGLVAFSGDAGLLVPLTSDYQAFAHYLRLANLALFDTAGTNMGAALDVAARHFVPRTSASRAVLLITDGDAAALSGAAGTSAMEAAKRLKAAGIPLYVLGIGSTDGAPIPLAEGGYIEQDGKPVTSRIDKRALRKLAAVSNGKFAMASDGDGDWHALYDNGLLALPGEKAPPSTTRAWRELYAWCLLPALVLLALVYAPAMTSAKMPGTGLLLAILLGWGGGGQHAHAASTPQQEAYDAYRRGQYPLAKIRYGALQGYDARMGEGAAAYRNKEYPYAAKQFTAAVLLATDASRRADALFNLGNSLYLTANLRAAADAYEGVLKLRHGDKKAQANLSLVAARLAKQAALDAYSKGILARGAIKDGMGLHDTGKETPEPGDEFTGQSAAMTGQDDGSPAGDQARSNAQGRQGGEAGYRHEDPDRLYRSAAKKLELLSDRAAVLEHEMVKRDKPRGTAAPEGMQPW